MMLPTAKAAIFSPNVESLAEILDQAFFAKTLSAKFRSFISKLFE
jgi:hypothetical protein